MKLDPLSVSAVYSVPELAGVGLTEDNAKEKGIDYEVGRCSFGDIPRGLISGDTEGILKLIFRRQDRRLLGVHISATSRQNSSPLDRPRFTIQA